MSLKEAILEVAAEMEAHAIKDTNPIGERTLAKLWAAQLRIACKAAPDTPAVPQGMAQALMPAPVQHAMMIEKAREEFRKNKQGQQVAEKITAIQTGGERMLELVGGDNDGVMWPAPADLPEGAKTKVGVDVYTFRNGKLEFTEKQV